MPATSATTRIPIGVALAGALATAALYRWYWPIITPDMTEFLLPWFDHIVTAGPVAAFAAPFSNYMPLYLYLLALVSPLAGSLPAVTLIKLVSVVGSAILA